MIIGANMLRKDGFKGVMTKHAFGVNRDNVFVGVDIKHVSNSPDQYFLESFEKEAKIPNLQNLFETPVAWSNQKFKLVEYPLFYEIEFDEIVFVARLVTLNVARKIKDGIDIFEYTLGFRKDVEGDNKDAIAAKKYLKYKEENEDGKKVLIEFDVKLTPAEEPAVTTRSAITDEKDTSDKESMF